MNEEEGESDDNEVMDETQKDHYYRLFFRHRLSGTQPITLDFTMNEGADPAPYQ